MNKLIKPGTNNYWNHFHDPEVKGKKWKLKTPTGETLLLDYGDPYPIQRYVNLHPELSEAINANNIKFWRIINKLKAPDLIWEKTYAKKHILESIFKAMAPKPKKQTYSGKTTTYTVTEQVKDAMDNIEYYSSKLNALTVKSRWTKDLHFWNITDNSFSFDRKTIKKEPNKWWLVNVDMHD